MSDKVEFASLPRLRPGEGVPGGGPQIAPNTAPEVNFVAGSKIERGQATVIVISMSLEPSWPEYVLILYVAQCLSRQNSVGQFTYLAEAQKFVDA